MNEEEKDPKPEGHEQDFSEFAKHSRPEPRPKEALGVSIGRVILRGIAIVIGVVALIFFLIVGTCFIR